MKKLTLIILVLVGTSFCVNSQNDTICNAIRVLKKEKTFKERKYMNTFSKKGFYIYKNYCYNLIFTDNKKVLSRIVEILNDTLFITSSFNKATALKRNIYYDTLKYSIKDIKTLQLITEDIDGYTRDINMDNFNIQLVKTKCSKFTLIKISLQGDRQIYTDSCILLKTKKILILSKSLKTKTDPRILADSYPYLTNNGIAFIYEKEGNIYKVHGLKQGK